MPPDRSATLHKPYHKLYSMRALRARAMSLVDRRTLRQPTVNTEGEGVDIYICKNCGNQHNKRFRIPRNQIRRQLVAAGLILGSALGGRGGGGGGFSGGSFGGGMTEAAEPRRWVKHIHHIIGRLPVRISTFILLIGGGFLLFFYSGNGLIT